MLTASTSTWRELLTRLR
ncbi:hypothetical protein ACFVYA_34855 [Amycolatopsis sp. NPDC058278]